jgi:pimeloyl-ACP methyl ester carboxylesterase
MYTSEQGKAAIHAVYQQKLEGLNIEYTTTLVHTAFGETNVLVTGNPEHPPLVLVHGANGCAPVALDVYPRLREHFRVYAVDVVGEPNRSSDRTMSKKHREYGRWLVEVLDGLDLQDVKLVGFSLGGLCIWQALAEDARRVQAAYMVAPAGVVAGNPFKGIFQLFLPMRRYIKRQDPKALEQVLGNLFTDEDPFARQFLGTVLQHFKMDFSPIKNITRAEAQRIQTPVHLFGAGRDLMFPGQKLLRRSQATFPNLKTAVLLPDSKHVQGRADNDRIQEHILSH